MVGKRAVKSEFILSSLPPVYPPYELRGEMVGKRAVKSGFILSALPPVYPPYELRACLYLRQNAITNVG
ncbi:MAG TPA: hypothetical protein ENF37_01880 [Beggiatoa sp.]|nr:hypothetical protein [Beggiatoa sp.]